GPYDASRRIADSLRGSSNQALHFLTSRIEAAELIGPADRRAELLCKPGNVGVQGAVDPLDLRSIAGSLFGQFGIVLGMPHLAPRRARARGANSMEMEEVEFVRLMRTGATVAWDKLLQDSTLLRFARRRVQTYLGTDDEQTIHNIISEVCDRA